MPRIRIGLLGFVILVLSVTNLHAATQWAIVIGVSQYLELPQAQWLRYAHQDARSFADLLKSRMVGVPPENVKMLLNSEATTRNIKEVLGSWLRDNSGPDDIVYVYFAGHGVVDDKQNEAYFVTYDTKPGEWYSTAYGMAELKRILGTLQYRHLILITDACKSANVGTDRFGSRDLEKALEAYQNVQLRYKGKEPAVLAEEEATLLYRLFLLKKRSPSIFKPAVLAEKSNTFKLDDPFLMVWSGGNLNIVDKERAFGFIVSGDDQAKAIPGQVVSFVSYKGEAYRISKSSLTLPNQQQPLPATYTKDGKKQSFDEITGIAANQYGDILVATHGPNGLYRLNRETGVTTPFTAGEFKTKKLAVDSEGNFYVLNDALTTVTIWDARGKTIATIQPTTFGNKEIVDFTVDSFDNIYLLDKEGQFVILGGLNQPADLKLKTIYKQQIVEQSKSNESKPMKDLRAMTVSPSGSVFVVSKQSLLSFQ